MNKSMFIVIVLVLSISMLSCCKPDPDPEPNNGNNPTDVNNPGNNGNSGVEEPKELKWENPWNATKIGDSAVYKTDAGEETWKLVDEDGVKTLVKTIPGDDMLGIPPTENKISLEELQNSQEPKWWETKREKGMDFSFENIVGEKKIKLNCTKINIGNREYTVCKDLPFDGVVELKIDGKTVRELVSFSIVINGK